MPRAWHCLKLTSARDIRLWHSSRVRSSERMNARVEPVIYSPSLVQLSMQLAYNHSPYLLRKSCPVVFLTSRILWLPFQARLSIYSGGIQAICRYDNLLDRDNLEQTRVDGYRQFELWTWLLDESRSERRFIISLLNDIVFGCLVIWVETEASNLRRCPAA